MFQKCVLFVLWMSCSVTAFADIVMTSNSFSENFDGMPTANVGGAFSATIGTQSTIAGTGWVGTKIAGTGTTASSLVADTGASNSGAIYSYGAAADTDRALGALASGTNVMAFGFKLTNSTGSTFQDITISFTQENWRSSTSAVNTIAASFSQDVTLANDGGFLSSTTIPFTVVQDLNLIGPAPVTTNGALAGNDPANQNARSFTLANINLANGSSLYFRWQDTNDLGSDAGLAIDNFTISAITAVPEPTSLALIGLSGCAGLAIAIRRRKANTVVA